MVYFKALPSDILGLYFPKMGGCLWFTIAITIAITITITI